MSSDFLAQLPGLTNPITHAGRVVYNAQRDAVETHQRKQGLKRGRERVYAENVMNDGDFTIQPYEICMRNKTSKYISGNPTDTDIHVFSSANGMLAPTVTGAGEANTRKLRLEAKEEEIAFAGIASNRAIYDPDNNANEAMLAVQVGGLQTLYNTGTEDINAGDIVMWRMPPLMDQDDKGRAAKRPLVAGVNRSKLLFQTVSYRTAQRSLTQKVLAILEKTGKEPDQKAAAIVATLNEQKSRVMGKALSSASQGKTFDILLGHYCI